MAEKARATGNGAIMLCERGASFGYNYLISDMRSLAVMRRTGCPVVFDATHSVQMPGGEGARSGGQPRVRAGTCTLGGRGGSGRHLHGDPPESDEALSDGPNAWPLGRMDELLECLLAIDEAVKARPRPEDVPESTASHSPGQPPKRRARTRHSTRAQPGTRRGCRTSQEQDSEGAPELAAIRDIRAREVLDSRGNPTVEADVVLAGGELGRAAVPSGASTGRREALELRDGEPKRYHGRGVRRAVANIAQRIRPALIDVDATDQHRVDHTMLDLDGTANKSNLGANAILAVSLACARAAALATGQPLFRYLAAPGRSRCRCDDEHRERRRARREQRRHAGVHDRSHRSAGSARAIRCGAEVFHSLKAVLSARGLVTAVGDEGGFAPDLASNEEAIEVILAAIAKAGYSAGGDVHLALDVASSEFYRDGRYVLDSEGVSCDPKRLRRCWPAGSSGTRSCPSKTAWRRRLGGMENPDRSPGRFGPARRRRPVRDRSQDHFQGRQRGRRELRARHGQSDRNPDRNTGTIETAYAAGVYCRDLSPVGETETRRLRISRSPPAPDRSRPVRFAFRSGRKVQSSHPNRGGPRPGWRVTLSGGSRRSGARFERAPERRARHGSIAAGTCPKSLRRTRVVGDCGRQVRT